AFEYLPKPFDVDHALALIRRAAVETRHAPPATPATDDAPEILGQAPAMQEVFRAIGRLSQSTATVLITGESGTGKELVARALHRRHAPESGRTRAPGSLPGGSASSPERRAIASAGATRARRRHSAARPSLPAQERARSRRRAEGAFGHGGARARRLRVSWQR